MLASFPMYDFPEIRAATDDWWRGIAAALARAGLEDVPGVLTRDPDVDVWHSPDLLLSQTCGYPLTHGLAGVVELVATPAYSAHGCSGADYLSLIVVSDESEAKSVDDLRGTVCAYSSPVSQSGYNALRAAIAPLAGGGAFFARAVRSGGHPISIAMVADGRADVCAVDCVTHAMLARYQPEAIAGTRVLGTTARAPGLPFVTRSGIGQDDMERIRDGLHAAFTDPALADARDALMITGLEVLDPAAYRCIDEMEDSARAAGYPQLH